jgi:hypothetical protein
MRMNQPYGNSTRIPQDALHQAQLPLDADRQHGHLKAAAVSELQEFFNTYYVPNNAIWSSPATSTVAKTKQWVEKYFAWIPKGTDPRASPARARADRGKRAVVPANVPLPAVIVGARIPTYASDEQYALASSNEILGSGRSSRLAAASSRPNPSAPRPSPLYFNAEDGGIFGSFGMLLAGKNPDEVEKASRKNSSPSPKTAVTEES